MLRKAARIADRLGAPWYALYVQTPQESAENIDAATQRELGKNLDVARQLGGTLLTGGRGTLIGTLIGVLIFTVVNSIFTQNNLETDVQNIAKGVIIVAAVLLQYGTTRTRKT